MKSSLRERSRQPERRASEASPGARKRWGWGPSAVIEERGEHLSKEKPQVKCPFCGHLADKVVDSRESKEGEAIRRRRQCLKCGRRFTSYERLDRIDYRVVKKDGRRERFDREKLMSGILKACEKRAVPVTRLEAIVDQLEQRLHDSPDKELPTTQIGEFVMSELKSLDQVAYVRFASVYRDFKDAHEFVETIRSLLGRHDLGVSGE